jgi:serine/threonine-protein kinase RsbW
MHMQLRQASADEQAVIRCWSRDPRDVASARGELLDTLALWGLGEIADAATLVLCELVTNAMRHAHTSPEQGIETRFLRTGDHVRIEVHDASDTWPVRRVADLESLNGRGLLLVDALADSWDVAPREGGGKIIWARFAASPEEGGPHDV